MEAWVGQRLFGMKVSSWEGGGKKRRLDGTVVLVWIGRNEGKEGAWGKEDVSVTGTEGWHWRVVTE